MQLRTIVAMSAALQLVGWTAFAANAPSAQQIVTKVLDADPFGLSGSAVSARLLVKDRSGATRQLTFRVRSMRHDAPYAKSLVRFTSPPDLAGAGFLQVQNRSGDDDRYLFLPELKRSRRIAGAMRSNSFMGTDFSFADLDRRDFREGDAQAKPDETLGGFACYRVDLTPKRSDSPYSKIEAWIRKDSYLPLQLKMYGRGNTLAKTFNAQEVRRVDGVWFITKSRMVDHVQSHSTDLVLESIAPLKDVSEDEFTVRNLEKL